MSRLIQARAPRTGAGTLDRSPTMAIPLTSVTTVLAGVCAAAGASCAWERKDAEASASAAPRMEMEEVSFRVREVIGIEINSDSPWERRMRKRPIMTDRAAAEEVPQDMRRPVQPAHDAIAFRLCCTRPRRVISRPWKKWLASGM